MNKGKSYVNRKQEHHRPESDYYPTPISLLWKLLEINNENHHIHNGYSLYEPACGEGQISNELLRRGYSVDTDDIQTTGKNFLECNKKYDCIITNPPFSLFDEFVDTAKRCSDKFIFIAKTNFFGAYQRNEKGIWENLKYVYVFNRQVDYRTPIREDGLFHVGNLITGWFIWDKSWKEDYWHTSIVDVQEYAKLGQFKQQE